MLRIRTSFLSFALAAFTAPLFAQPSWIVDISKLSPDRETITRVLGSSGTGRFGVPVAGPGDVDGDGNQDFAVAYMTSSPMARSLAGEVDLVFGRGSVGSLIDTASDQAEILRIVGDIVQENAGNEIWIDDLNGDEYADLLICRQNFGLPDRLGSGALSIVFGSPLLREMAQAGQVLDLRDPPAEIDVLTLVGAQAGGRLGIWIRTGDVDGDGIAEALVGADQENGLQTQHRGAAYLIRGSSQLARTEVIDLIGFGTTSLQGNLARIVPAEDGQEFHFGATCQLADLDGNGRAEVLAAAALNRSGATLRPSGSLNFPVHGSGGPPRGRLFIVWDEAFPQDDWPQGYQVDLADDALAKTIIRGGALNDVFGEEIIGGGDFDGDGQAELFVGDLTGDGTQGQRRASGVGHVFYNAALLRGLDFTVDTPPELFSIVTILGPVIGAIGSDTVNWGDFDGDGFSDLLIGNPHDNPVGRVDAGTIHILFGRRGLWPTIIDTAPGAFPDPSAVRITEIRGASGNGPGDLGDTLCYSVSVGDVDGDGLTDIVSNEMLGNGSSENARDVGNLIVLPGWILSQDRRSRPPSSVRPPRQRPGREREGFGVDK